MALSAKGGTHHLSATRLWSDEPSSGMKQSCPLVRPSTLCEPCETDHLLMRKRAACCSWCDDFGVALSLSRWGCDASQTSQTRADRVARGDVASCGTAFGRRDAVVKERSKRRPISHKMHDTFALGHQSKAGTRNAVRLLKKICITAEGPRGFVGPRSSSRPANEELHESPTISILY